MTNQPTPNPDSDEAIHADHIWNTSADYKPNFEISEIAFDPDPDPDPDPDYGIALAMQSAVQPHLDAIDTSDPNFQAGREDQDSLLEGPGDLANDQDAVR